MWNKDFVSKSDIAWQLSVIVYSYFKGKTLRKMQMFLNLSQFIYVLYLK